MRTPWKAPRGSRPAPGWGWAARLLAETFFFVIPRVKPRGSATPAARHSAWVPRLLSPRVPRPVRRMSVSPCSSILAWLRCCCFHGPGGCAVLRAGGLIAACREHRTRRSALRTAGLVAGSALFQRGYSADVAAGNAMFGTFLWWKLLFGTTLFNFVFKA